MRNLTQVKLSNTIEEIQAWAFYGTGISEIEIPEGVSEIGKGVFGDIDINLFTVSNNNSNYKAVNGMLLTKDGKTLVGGVNGNLTIPSGIETIDYWSCSGRTRLNSVSIPSTTKNIKDGAFRGSGLRQVSIPDSVIELGQFAFENCVSLQSASIGNGLSILNYGTFAGCTNLSTVNLGTSVHHIDSFAFGQCQSLTSITIPAQVSWIGENAFADCTGLMTINMPGFTMQEVTDGGYSTWGFESGATITCRDGNI